MESLLNMDLSQVFSIARVSILFRALLILLLGIPAIYFLGKWSRKYVTKRFNAQKGMVTGKVIYYTGLVIIIITFLNELGFSLGPILGAAGIIGIAVGFASQTSISNVISGVFLIAEQPFMVADIIRVGDITGMVLSIDILSVKLRTFDNQFVRIPNETILKSQVVNLTRFPIRRIDVRVSVAYKEDIARVREVLQDVAQKNPLCLQEPEPLFIFSGFGNSSIDLTFAVWAVREDWLKVKNQIYEQIKKRFDEEGIEIPFPHLSFYTGLASKPLPIEIVNKNENFLNAEPEMNSNV